MDDKLERRRELDRQNKAKLYAIRKNDPVFIQKERDRFKRYYQENKERKMDVFTAWTRNPANAEKIKENQKRTYIEYYAKKKEKMKTDPEYREMQLSKQRQANHKHKLKKLSQID
jgi:hypothetical protein